jgi:hypothetical protein
VLLVTKVDYQVGEVVLKLVMVSSQRMMVIYTCGTEHNGKM